MSLLMKDKTVEKTNIQKFLSMSNTEYSVNISVKTKGNKRNAKNKNQPLTPKELEVRRENRWLKRQKGMKKIIENINKTFVTMTDELPFTLVNHSNIRFEYSYSPVQLIPLLKPFFQSFLSN